MTSSSADAPLEPSQDYWFQAREPFVCLVFLAPLLVTYEAGVFWLGGRHPDAIRNGADFWMRGWLHQTGFGHVLLLPALVIAGLLAWQFFGNYPWRARADTLAGMLAESLLFAFVLVIVGQLQDLLFREMTCPLLTLQRQAALGRIVMFLGAGLYEEVLFRLCLLPICFGLFRLSRLSVGWSAALAVISTSLVFSFAHYIGPAPEPFALFSFTFRLLAGSFFAGLFVLRGFGITVGCHAAYDVIAGILL